MEKYVIIKSNENISQLYIYVKNYMQRFFRKDNIECKNTGTSEIYIEKNCFDKASEAFAEYLIRNYVFFFVQDFLDSTSYVISTEDEYDLCESISHSVISCKEPNIKDKIKNDLIEFSKIYSEINLDGFVLFSFRKYEQPICDCITEELIMIRAEEEYNKILYLISNYIIETENNTEILNFVFQDDNSFVCYNESHVDITEKCLKDAENEFEKKNYVNTEDELLDILLTQNPAFCVIHLKGNKLNKNLLKTIKIIFGDRVKICTDNCNFCNP